MESKNLKIATKLWLAVGLLVAALIAISLFAVSRLGALQADGEAQASAMAARVEAATRWSGLTDANAARTQAIVLSNETAIEAAFKDVIAATSAQITDVQKKIEAMDLSAEDRAQMKKIAESRQVVLDTRSAARKLKADGKLAEASALVESKYNPAVTVYLGNLKAFVKLQEKAAQEAQERTHNAMTLTLKILGAGMLLVIIFALLGARWLISSIMQPLHQANELAARIAGGDLTTQFQVQRSDEFGELLHSLLVMTQSLGRMVMQVRQSTDSIAVASAEIAVGNNDLSHRTEQTSADLQQTSSSMAQLTHTVQQSVGSARQASELAANASAVAQRGGSVVTQVVATMQDINHSSKKIADIIGVIDGIAFQTNILALNAAVEAARAGEQGRGFAVVASEVRNLAQRSAQAAKEIKQLIDASVDKVESGARLVADAGTTMDDIVQSVQHVTATINEITTAASAQSAGIEEVNHAVGNLDQMTQQNAALVEESAAAAQSLREQASQLTQIVAAFKIDGAGGAPTPVTPALTRATGRGSN